jgi:hypothetical protein
MTLKMYSDKYMRLLLDYSTRTGLLDYVEFLLSSVGMTPSLIIDVEEEVLVAGTLL